MKNIIRVVLEDGTSKLINEDQVCSVEPGKSQGTLKTAIVRMSNGDELIITDPDWDQWENDLFLPQ